MRRQESVVVQQRRHCGLHGQRCMHKGWAGNDISGEPTDGPASGRRRASGSDLSAEACRPSAGWFPADLPSCLPRLLDKIRT